MVVAKPFVVSRSNFVQEADVVCYRRYACLVCVVCWLRLAVCSAVSGGKVRVRAGWCTCHTESVGRYLVSNIRCQVNVRDEHGWQGDSDAEAGVKDREE